MKCAPNFLKAINRLKRAQASLLLLLIASTFPLKKADAVTEEVFYSLPATRYSLWYAILIPKVLRIKFLISNY